jgi:hypothetical protein
MDQFSQTERRLQVKMDERVVLQGKHDELLRSLDGNSPSEAQAKQMKDYRTDMADVDTEIDDLSIQADRDREAAAKSQEIRRRANAFAGKGEEGPNGEPVYRSLGQVAIDRIVTSGNVNARNAVAQQGLSQDEIERAGQRLQALEVLERTPATTLTSDIAGLSPPQHIAQIFQIIDSSRPLVEAAGVKVDLNKLTVTYPQLDATPVVAVQGTQKTEAGNTGMDVSMVTKTASTYLGGGNLSWQAIEFSTPSAFDLWFRAIAADYALKTETDAATVVSASAFLNNVDTPSPIGGTPTYAELMAAIAGGAGEVYSNSGRMANAVIMAPDRYWYMLGLTTSAPLAFSGGGALSVNPDGRALRVIASRGLNAGEIIVGDMDGLLVAENPGAPVRMFVSEPAIAGVEVGLVGAFEAAVVDDGAFSLITTAS